MDWQESKVLLRKSYKYRIELHAHTSPGSTCAEFPPQEVIKTYAELGYDAIAITNHFMKDYQSKRPVDAKKFVDWYLKDYEEAVKYGEEYGIKVLLGAEIRFTENMNDYLIYGIDRKILEDVYESLPYGIDNIREKESLKNLLIIQAHPFREHMEQVNPEILDGMETLNLHPNHNGKIGPAVKYAKKHRLNITTAGTDYHHKDHEGMGAILTKKLPKDTFELASILRSKDYLLEIGQQAIVLP